MGGNFSDGLHNELFEMRIIKDLQMYSLRLKRSTVNTSSQKKRQIQKQNKNDHRNCVDGFKHDKQIQMKANKQLHEW
jgi:hypothetical protein